MKRVALDIGFPKTGTTSFQHFSRGNRPLREAHGAIFPRLRLGDRGETGHSALLAAVLDDPPPHLAPMPPR